MNGSFQPRRAGTTMRCPELETGRNSVSPCTIPMTIAWMYVSMSMAAPAGGRLRRCALRALAHARSKCARSGPRSRLALAAPSGRDRFPTG